MLHIKKPLAHKIA